MNAALAIAPEPYRLEHAAPVLPGNAVRSWLGFVDASPATMETYTRTIRPFQKFLDANGITRPTRQTLIAYRSALEAEGKKASTVSAYLTATRLLFTWLNQEGIYPNVAERVKGKRPSKEHKRDFLPAEGIRATLAAIDRSNLAGLRDYALVLLMASDGLRTIEVSRAAIEDVREEAGDVVLHVQGKGRADKGEFVRLSPRTYAAIRAYLAARKAADPRAPLFAASSNNHRAQGMTTRAIRAIVKARMVAARYDSPRLTAHSLRHSAVTLALKAGVAIDEVRAFARHRSIDTTLIYAHDLDAHSNRAAAAVEGSIFAAEA
jgi:integrase/recombinase XerC